VSMIVSVFEIPVVDVRMLMGLSSVAVFVRMLDMFMIMLKVRVSVRHILMRVFMSVRRGHPCPLFLARLDSMKAPNHMRIDWAS
jgi:hypothetical protein